MTVSNKQVRTMQKVMTEKGQLGIAAVKVGMCRQTASKYYRDGRLPSEKKTGRAWRTRPNPFECSG